MLQILVRKHEDGAHGGAEGNDNEDLEGGRNYGGFNLQFSVSRDRVSSLV